MTRVSVIVPSFRDAEGLEQTFHALLRQRYPTEQVELLFVDNTPEFALEARRERFRPARLLHEPTPGSYAARNRALQEATGDVIAFTDADCLPDETWIAEGVRALSANPSGALVAGRIEVFAADPARPTAAELFELAMAFPQESYVVNAHFGATANVFVPSELFRKVGPFLSGLASGGDQEFGRRVHAAGFPVVYCDTAVVRHPARRRIGDLLKKSRRVLRGVRDLERLGHLPEGSLASGLLTDMRPPVTTGWNILRDVSLGGWPRRTKAAGVLTLWRYHRAFCRVQLLLERS